MKVNLKGIYSKLGEQTALLRDYIYRIDCMAHRWDRREIEYYEELRQLHGANKPRKNKRKLANNGKR